MGWRKAVTMLMSFDANHDGKLSRSELPERFRACSIARIKTKMAFSRETNPQDDGGAGASARTDARGGTRERDGPRMAGEGR